MRIILRTDISKLGKSGDILEVKDGYARNFLIPKGLALEATSTNLKKIKEEQKQKALKFQREKKRAEQQASELSKQSLTIPVEVKEKDQLYGSITSSEIAKALEEQNIQIEKKNILLENPIKTLGIYEVPIRLHPEIITKIRIWVVKK